MTDTVIAEHYAENFERLVGRLMFRCGTWWDSEDAIQTAYERAFKYRASFDPSQSDFGAWFNRIIVNAIKDQIKANKGSNDLEFEEDLVDGLPCTQYTEQISKEIRKRIKGRQPHIAEILTLFFENGYGAKDISLMVESTHLVVNQTIYRFRQELKRDYKKDGAL